ncbi:MAG: DUF2059 domain-containing protein [Burkholderiaceae bacterium]|nr:DUF2059 domain-containing protein [Burkholderiaceae bacterium]
MLLALLTALCTSASAQSQPFREDVREIVEVAVPAQKAVDGMLQQFLPFARSRQPTMDDAHWAALTSELRSFLLSEVNAPGSYLDALRQSYAQKLTETEAHEIATFFRSVAGRKYIQQRDAAALALSATLQTESGRLALKMNEQFNALLEKYAKR